MSHDISINKNGDAEMAYSGEKPWHHLGTKVHGLMTTEEALNASHLNWDVEKVAVLSAKDLSIIPDRYTVIRSDTNFPLGVVGKRYIPISNKEAFSFFDIVLGKSQGRIESIGAINHGKRVWCLARMPESFEALPGDCVERYLLCSNSHDGSSCLEILFTSIRVVCNNTLTMALNSASHSVTVRHTSNWEERLGLAHLALNSSQEYWSSLQEVCRNLASTCTSRSEINCFLDTLLPVENHEKKNTSRDKVLELFETGKGTEIQGVKGSRWGLFNAYSEYLDYEKRTHNGSDRWERTTFGSGNSERKKALDFLLSA